MARVVPAERSKLPLGALKEKSCSPAALLFAYSF
jgi:hypothetical protein